MTAAIQRRRGSTAQHAAFTGLNGELTVDTDKKTVVVHDGLTTGGFPLARSGVNSDITSLTALTSLPALTSINGGQLAGHRNKIIGHYEQNQRMLTSAVDDQYCADRWYVLTESGNVTVAQVVDPEPGAPFGWKLTQPDATAKRMGLATIIESKNIKQYRSTAMNLAHRVKPSFAGNVRYAIIEHTGTADVVTSDVVNNWGVSTFTAGNFFIAGLNILKTGTVAPGANTYGWVDDWTLLGASCNNVILFFWSESAVAQGGTLEFNRPQFEPGTVRTPHEWRLNDDDLVLPYYEIGENTWYDSNAIYTGPYFAVRFVKTKRAAPTVTRTGDGQVTGSTAGTYVASSNKQGFYFAKNGVTNAIGGNWVADAEL